MDYKKIQKPKSYQDLIKSFQQVQIKTYPSQQKPVKPRTLQLKKPNNRQNKQNLLSKQHTQSLLQKTSHQQSYNWSQQQQILQQHSSPCKDRQQQFSYNKFITKITGKMMELTGICPPELLIAKVTYLHFLQALQQLTFIKKNYQPAPNDIVSELWNQLCDQGQAVGTLILFTASILNMHFPSQKMEKYHYIWNKYADLRYTRLEQLGKTKNTQNQQQFPLSPQLCQRSRDLMAKKSKSKDRYERYMQQKTFYQISQSVDGFIETSQSKQQFDTRAGNRRSDILYKMAKEKSLEKRRDKRSSQVEYQKSISELTFHPKIHLKHKENPSKTTIHGEQDSINRMVRGRVEREVRRIIKEKGLPYNEKLFQRMKKERYDLLMKARTINLCKKDSVSQDQPIENDPPCQPVTKQQQLVRKEHTNSHPLVLSIEIDEGRCEKLVIYKGQCYKQAAANFISELKLQPDLYSKLIAGVQHALKFQLQQIDQDSFESMCESPRQ